MYNSVRTYYSYKDGVLLSEKKGSEERLYMYDESGTIVGVKIVNGSTESYYYYILNIQGDVIGIVDEDGMLVVEYTYDEWGNVLSITGSEAATIGATNPIRYRGYYYDAETGFYYLLSRYYDPEIGRFLNADGYVSTGQELLGYNMFAYCGNNPINNKDLYGTRHVESTTVEGESDYHRDISCYWEQKARLSKYNPEPAGTYECGNIYIVTPGENVAALYKGDVLVIDERLTSGNSIKIVESCLITDDAHQYEICEVIKEYTLHNPVLNWSRTVNSMVVEWDWHNCFHILGISCERSMSVDLDMGSYANSDKAYEQIYGYLMDRSK